MEEYKKKTNTGDDVFITLQTSEGSPRPTAVLFGWLAASHRNLSKYSNLYKSLGYNTVQLIAPASTVFSLHPRSHGHFLVSVFRILAADPRLIDGGLVFHLFSNGGAFTAPHLAEVQNEHGDDAAVISKCRDSLSALVFDSSPCYLHDSQGARAINEGLGIIQPFSYIVTFAFVLLCWFQRLFVVDLRTWFWERLTNARYPCPEYYVYSTSDHLLDWQRLDDLIDKRRTDGRNISVFRVHDSPHVLILRKHPHKYQQLIKDVNDASVNSWRTANKLPPWLPHDPS